MYNWPKSQKKEEKKRSQESDIPRRRDSEQTEEDRTIS